MSRATGIAFAHGPQVGDPPLAERWRRYLIGQDHAIGAIASYLDIAAAALNPPNRPVGTFLLIGPTGTGKTHTVETLAETLHGGDKHVLTVNCGEYHGDHEVAKLIGAPPGYLGHRETQPAITQAKLNAIASERSPISIILFDEIEKAAPALCRLLLGILDKSTLRLGDGTSVNFDRALIFMTSNLGARDLQDRIDQRFAMTRSDYDPTKSTRTACVAAVKKHFTPEFINRVDELIHYDYLSPESVRKILDVQIEQLNALLLGRVGIGASIRVSDRARDELCRRGVSRHYGARELKRILYRDVIVHLARLRNAGWATGEVTLGFDGEFRLERAA